MGPSQGRPQATPFTFTAVGQGRGRRAVAAAAEAVPGPVAGRPVGGGHSAEGATAGVRAWAAGARPRREPARGGTAAVGLLRVPPPRPSGGRGGLLSDSGAAQGALTRARAAPWPARGSGRTLRSSLALAALYAAASWGLAAGGKPGRRKAKPGADYYAILGVDDNADVPTIKKAYRAKSLEFHPDKCEDDKEVCQTKFIEVSTAYEVLSDPEKRKIYDQDGEEGLKEGAQNSQQAKAMFRQFFGREPDGNVKIVNQGGRMMFMEEGEPGPKEDIFGDSTNVTELTGDVYKSYVNERDEPWLVLFYKPNDDDSVQAKPDFVKFANTFKEFLKIAAVNCRQQRDICNEASINSFPALRWFPEDKKNPPEVYEGTLSAKDLGKWANTMMPDYSRVVEDKRQLRAWLDDAKNPVLLFTDKSAPPPMWKALSREFKNRVSLAAVCRCDKTGVFKTPLQREYDVRIPGIVLLDPLQDVGKVAEKFEHSMKKEVLSIWMMKNIAQQKKAGPQATFKEWSKQRYEAGDCGPKDGQFCFLWLKAGADPAVEEATRQLAQKYRTDPIKLMWANVEMSPSLLEAFGLETSDATDFFVAFRPKRNRFKVHEGPLRFQEMDAFMDGVMNGGPLTNQLKVPHVEL